MASDAQDGFTIVIDTENRRQAQYGETPIVFETQTQSTAPDKDTPSINPQPRRNVSGDCIPSSNKRQIPEQIRRMRNLYQYGNGSFQQICKNFYVQGKFMENYEDNAPWYGEVSSYYFQTYHNLSLKQLRGYFTWRTELRKGNYQKHCMSFVLMYLYELVNGIGAASAEDSLRKMKEFETGYIDAGLGDKSLRSNIRKWMLEFAVLNGIAPDVARTCADPEMLERDAAFAILHNPKQYSDQEVFNALCSFGGKKMAESKLIQQHGAQAISLFAAVWRLVLAQYRQGRKNLFTVCFGKRSVHFWYPLARTLYYERRKRKAVTYELNPCRSYYFKRGEWIEYSYHKLSFDKQKLTCLLHETDRRLRLYLKVGYPLKERKEAAWAVPYIEAVIGADRQAKIEAAHPKITIDFSGLDKIREEALETQDSLLTEEDTQGVPEPFGNSIPTAEHTETPAIDEKLNRLGKLSEDEKAASALPSELVPLDGTHIQLLHMLLCGEPIQQLIAAQHGLASVIADSINEALFDCIGDNAVECDGEIITLVEDYRDDIISILGGGQA